jgi:signal peptidase I
MVALIPIAIVAATWFTWLRPTALGGDVSYVVIQGSSMEPTYEDGDLVVVREDSRYEHGDVIAFRAGGTFDDPTRIIHRIIGGTAEDGFVTQGDNRDRTDPWRPSTEDVIGRAMLHVPMAGDAAGIVTRPESFAALGGAAVVIGGTKHRRRRRRRLTPATARRPDMIRVKRVIPDPDPRPARLSVSTGGRFTRPRWAFIGLILSVAVAVPVLALAWSALRAPDSTQRTETTGAIDYGIGLDYRFSGAPSPVYPEGNVDATRNAAGAVVSTGPLYSRLLDRLDATVAFRATENGADRLESTYRVDVTVATPGGWTTTLDTIDGGTFERTASEIITVDLPTVADQVASVASLTGVGGDSYTITVTPRLDVSGGNDSTEVSEQLAAPMTFAVEGNLITADAVEVADTRTLARTVNDRAMYAIGPLEMRTQPARAVLSGLALVLVAGIAWFASVLFGGVGLIEPDRIAARYRSQIVDVAVATAPPGPVVMVGGIDELSRIAKVEQTVILHEDLGDGAHRYRVFLGSVTYEYEAAPEHAGAASTAATETDIEESGG